MSVNLEFAALYAVGAACGGGLAAHLANPRRSAFAYDVARNMARTPRLSLVGGAVAEGVVGGSTELGLNAINTYSPAADVRP